MLLRPVNHPSLHEAMSKTLGRNGKAYAKVFNLEVPGVPVTGTSAARKFQV